MPTIIDELTMTLTLDPGGFKEGAQQAENSATALLNRMMATLGKIEQATKSTADNTARTQQDAAKRTAQEHETSARRSTEAFNKVGESIKKAGIELLAFLGISMTVSGMERLFMDISKTNMQAGYLSQTLGMNTREMTEWQGAASRLGATAEGVAQGFGTIQQQIQRLNYFGQSSMMPVLRNLLGIEMQNSRGVAKSPTQLLLEIADQIKARNLSGPQAQFIMDNLGMGGLTNMVMQGRPAIEKELATQRQIGSAGIMDSEQSREMLNALDKVQSLFGSIARVVTLEVSPAVTQIANQIFDWLTKNRTWIEEYLIDGLRALGRMLIEIKNDFVEAFNSQTAKEIGGAIKEVATEVDTLVRSTVGWKNLIEGVLELWTGWRFAKMLANIGLVRGALSLIGVGAPAVGGVAAGVGGAAGAAGAVGGVVGGIAAAAPELVIAGMLGTLYMEFKNASQADQAKSLGFEKAPMAVPGSFFTMPGYKKDGKMYRPDEVQAQIDAHLKELEDAKRAAEENTKSLDDNTRELRLKNEENGYLGRAATPGSAASVAPRELSTQQALKADDLMQRVMRIWGVSQAEAAPIVSAMIKESGGKSDVSFGGGAYQTGTDIAVGLFQHTGSRHRALEAWAKEQGLDPKDPDTQIKFGKHEADTVAAYRNWRATLQPGASPEAFGNLFENGGVPGGYAHGDYIEALRKRNLAAPASTPATPAPASSTPAPATPAWTRPTQWQTGYGHDTTLGANTAAQRTQLAFAGSTDRSQSSETHINAIHVHTAATDAHGIARDLKGALKRYDYATQADVGLA